MNLLEFQYSELAPFMILNKPSFINFKKSVKFMSIELTTSSIYGNESK